MYEDVRQTSRCYRFLESPAS